MALMAVIDFETTGLSPAMGDRATEVAIVLVDNGQVVDRFQSLMNAGQWISPFIEAFTGISNAMLATAPAADDVMARAQRFVGQVPMVAHNASFDRRFWQTELARIGEPGLQNFACTLLVARRLYPQAPSHKLGVLADYHGLPNTGRAHRALADAEMAAALLGKIQQDLHQQHQVMDPSHDFLMAVQRCSRSALPAFIRTHTAPQAEVSY